MVTTLVTRLQHYRRHQLQHQQGRRHWLQQAAQLQRPRPLLHPLLQAFLNPLLLLAPVVAARACRQVLGLGLALEFHLELSA